MSESRHATLPGGRRQACGPKHFKLMLACAEICQTSANFMLMGAQSHQALCGVCAQACEACAQSCEQLDDMQGCVNAYDRCADSCRKMARQQIDGSMSNQMGGEMSGTMGSESRTRTSRRS